MVRAVSSSIPEVTSSFDIPCSIFCGSDFSNKVFRPIDVCLSFAAASRAAHDGYVAGFAGIRMFVENESYTSGSVNGLR